MCYGCCSIIIIPFENNEIYNIDTRRHRTVAIMSSIDKQVIKEAFRKFMEEEEHHNCEERCKDDCPLRTQPVGHGNTNRGNQCRCHCHYKIYNEDTLAIDESLRCHCAYHEGYRDGIRNDAQPAAGQMGGGGGAGAAAAAAAAAVPVEAEQEAHYSDSEPGSPPPQQTEEEKAAEAQMLEDAAEAGRLLVAAEGDPYLNPEDRAYLDSVEEARRQQDSNRRAQRRWAQRQEEERERQRRQGGGGGGGGGGGRKRRRGDSRMRVPQRFFGC